MVSPSNIFAWLIACTCIITVSLRLHPTDCVLSARLGPSSSLLQGTPYTTFHEISGGIFQCWDASTGFLGVFHQIHWGQVGFTTENFNRLWWSWRTLGASSCSRRGEAHYWATGDIETWASAIHDEILQVAGYPIILDLDVSFIFFESYAMCAEFCADFCVGNVKHFRSRLDDSIHIVGCGGAYL